MVFKVSLSLEPEDYVPAEPAPMQPRGFRASDFRVQPGANLASPHWLLSHPYGREVLIHKLREVRPDLQFFRFRTPPELEPFLDAMIDLMGMRDWPEPRTVGERVRAGLMLLRIGFAQGGGYELPDWRGLYAGT